MMGDTALIWAFASFYVAFALGFLLLGLGEPGTEKSPVRRYKK